MVYWRINASLGLNEFTLFVLKPEYFGTIIADTNIFQVNKNNAMAADALAPCITISSAILALTMQVGFQLPMLPQFWEMIEHANIKCCFLKTFMHIKGYRLTHWSWVVANFDAVAQAIDFKIEGRQVVFLCWMQDLNFGSLRHQIASRMNSHPQTNWAIKDQAKTWTHSLFLWWASIRAHLTSRSGDIHVCCC